MVEPEGENDYPSGFCFAKSTSPDKGRLFSCIRRRFTKMLSFFLFLCYNGKNMCIAPKGIIKGDCYGIIYQIVRHAQ